MLFFFCQNSVKLIQLILFELEDVEKNKIRILNCTFRQNSF